VRDVVAPEGRPLPGPQRSLLRGYGCGKRTFAYFPGVITLVVLHNSAFVLAKPLDQGRMVIE
jgi:hypothetical protein